MADNKNLEQLDEGAKLTAESLAGVTKNIKSIEDAYKNFLELVKKEGLESATKQFYDLIESMKSFQKQAGDINAAAEETSEKINFLGYAIRDANAELRKGAVDIVKNAKQIKALDEELQALGDTEAKLLSTKEKLETLRKQAEEGGEVELEQIENLRIAVDALNKEDTKRRTLTEDRNKLDKDNKRLESELKLLALSMPLLKYEEARLEATNKIRNSMDDIISKLTSGAERSNIFASAFLSMQKGIDGTSTSLTGLFKTMGEGMTQSLLNPELAINRVFNLINDKLIKSTLDFDQALADVGRSTGGFRKEFEAVAMNMGGVSFANLTRYGISIKQYGEAYQALSKSIAGFNNMSIEQKRILSENAASMTTLGISADSYGNLTAKFMNTIGESAKRSGELINQLAKDATALGKGIGEYTSEFEKAMSSITGYGRNAITIFKELNAVSASTMGIVTSQDLLSISDKFKDFESAADSVSKLNAVLGGTSVNILDMMKADPAEQIMMIKRAAGESSLEFDKLNIGYKRLLAEYFGGDVLKAQKFFNADLQEAQNLINKQVESEEELNKRKEQNVAFQQKLNALIDNMRVSFMPILEPMGKLVSAFGYILNFPGLPLILTFGMIAKAIQLAGAALGRVRAIAGEATAAVQALGISGQTAAQQTKSAVDQETAAKERDLAITRQLAAAEEQRKLAGGTIAGGGTPPTTPSTGGGTGAKSIFAAGGSGRMILGMGAIMGAGWLLSEASEYLENKRQKELEQIRSQLKIDEINARKAAFPNAITTNAESVQDVIIYRKDNGEERIFKLEGRDGQKDEYQGTVSDGKGGSAIGFGTPNGQAKPMLKEINNTQFTSAIQSTRAETTNSSTKETKETKEFTSTSSTEASKQNVSVIVNAMLKLENNEMRLITERVSADIKGTV